MLVPKSGKKTGLFRPIFFIYFFLDTVGKLEELVLVNRLNKKIDQKHGFSNSQ